jgi:hypothetical protein
MGESPPIGPRTLEELLDRVRKLEKQMEKLSGEWSRPESTAEVGDEPEP